MAQFLDENYDVAVLIDSDMSWKWEDMHRLLALTQVYPLVSGVYCARQDPPKFVVNLLSSTPDANGVYPHSGTGLGFTAINREVFEKLNVPEYESAHLKKNVKRFFQTEIQGGKLAGEDVFFFRKCVEQGIIPAVDLSFQLVHHGTKDYNYQILDYIKERENGIQAN